MDQLKMPVEVAAAPLCVTVTETKLCGLLILIVGPPLLKLLTLLMNER